MLELETPHGPARAHVSTSEPAVGGLVLGHGSGGGVGSADLVGAGRAASSAGLSVVLVEQPYRVAGRRAPAPASQLDTAWSSVVAQLREGPLAGIPVLTGGRSAGARVACRTAEATGSVAVICLAFPLHPPGRPEKSRLAELDGVTVPVLVVQGEKDPFGMPPDAPGRTVTRIHGTHSLNGDAVEAAVSAWLATAAPWPRSP